MSQFFFGKPWQESWTAWGVVAYAGITTVVTGIGAMNLLSPETVASANVALEKIGAVAIALGLRRAAKSTI